MLSTNFFSNDWEDFDTVALARMATTKYPDHALGIRSVNQLQNKKLFSSLYRNGWLPVVTRQVYLLDKYDLEKRDIRRDLDLLRSKKYVFVDPELNSLEHFKIAEALYNQLYLEKYTEENIQYTALYMQELYKNNLLHLKLLLDTERNTFVGVVGMVGDECVITAPIVGYEMSRPREEALYRRCLIYIIKYANDRELLLNLSSGAPDFKTNRGAVSEIEYTFVNVKHLNVAKRLIWGILSKVSLYIYKPLLQNYKL